MAKTVKTTTYYRRRFRKYYRRKKLTNNPRTNYYKAKLDFELVIKRGETTLTQTSWTFNGAGLDNRGSFAIDQIVGPSGEYTPYRDLFNEVMLTGVAFYCVPMPYSAEGTTLKGMPMIHYGWDQTSNTNGNRFFCGTAPVKKYFKNIDRKYVATSQVLANAPALGGFFYLFSQGESPNANLVNPLYSMRVSVYLKFRKNKLVN